MSNEYVWQPKDDQENAILAAANHLLRFGHPPVGERLCRRVPAPQASVPVEVQPPQHVREYIMLALAEQGVEVDGEALRFVVYNDAPKDAWLTEQVDMPLPPEIREALDTIWHAANLFDASMRGFHTNNGKLAAALQTCGQWLDSQRQGQQQEADE